LLHRALASLLCALGAAALGLGIASATVWRPSDTLVAQAQGAPGTSLLVTDPGVLDLAADEVTVRASATSGTVVIALGRSADVDAWVGDDAHTRVTGLAGWHVLATEKVAASAPEAANPPADAAGDPSAAPAAEDPAAAPAAPDPSAAPAAEDPAAAPAAPDPSAAPAAEDPAADAVPDPAGSDLWVDQASGERAATLEWTRQDGRWSVLVAATAGGVPSVALEWPQVVTTPWLVPGVVVGSLLLLIGIAWWVLILVAGRRRARVAAAPVPEPAALAPAEPALPLTRRQMRELEEQRSSRKRHERETVLARFPMLVPGPKAPDDSQEGRERRGRHGSDDVSAPQAVAVARPPGEGTRGRHGAAAPTASAAEQSRSRRSEQTRGAPASGRTAGGLLGRLRRRPAGTPAPAPTAPVEPVAVAPAPPLFTTQRAGTPAASADAWRRAWGLTGADSTQGPVTTAATPTEEPPEAPPRRRRPDGSER